MTDKLKIEPKIAEEQKPVEQKDLVQKGIDTLSGLIKDKELKDISSNFMNDSYRNLRNIQAQRREDSLRNIQQKPNEQGLREVKKKPTFWERTKNFFKNVWGTIRKPLGGALPKIGTFISNRWLNK